MSAETKSLNRLRSYLLGDRHSELTDKQHELLKRYQSAFAMLRDHGSMHSAHPIYVEMFKVSDSQAYVDLRRALKLFGDVLSGNKEGQRWVIYERNLHLYELARAKGDIEQMGKALDRSIKILGLDKEDPDMPDFAKLQPNVYPIILDEQSKPLLKQLQSLKGAVRLSNLKTENVEEAVVEDGSEDQGGDQTSS